MRRNKPRELFKNEKGVTLVELLLSIALLAIIVTPIFGTIYSAFVNNVTANDRIEAVAISEKLINEIKAKKVLNITGPSNPGPTYENGKFKVTSTIQLVDEGSISVSDDYTYDPQEADKPDFELILKSDTADDERKVTSLTINKLDINSNIIESNRIDSFPVSTGANFKVYRSYTGYKYSLGTKAQADEFSPFNLIDPLEDSIKVRVGFTGNSPLTADEQLKVYTYFECDKNLKLYIIDRKPETSGISFINKGSRPFETVYMDTGVVTTSEQLNKLFKITVTVEKNDNPIYTTAAFVKK